MMVANYEAGEENKTEEAFKDEESPTPLDKTEQTTKTSTMKKKPREKNEHFKDLEENGRWGVVSKKEKYAVFGLLIAAIIAVVVTVVLLIGNKEDPTAPPSPKAAARTPAPSMAPPEVDPELQYDAIYKILQNNTFVDTTPLDTIRESGVEDLEGLASNEAQVASVRAMSWILYEDILNVPPEDSFLLPRYALALLYYQFGGENWIIPGDTSNWLSREHVCNWQGVVCNRFNTRMEELDFEGFGLTGSIPPEINLFQDINSLVLARNQLTGTPPFLAIGSLPRLTILFLNNNQLEGSLDDDLNASGILSTLMVQVNKFTGSWPRNFCPRAGQPDVFNNFGLDCGSIVCRASCCNPTKNCFS